MKTRFLINNEIRVKSTRSSYTRFKFQFTMCSKIYHMGIDSHKDSLLIRGFGKYQIQVYNSSGKFIYEIQID